MKSPKEGKQQESVNRRVGALAIPAIVSNVTVPLLGISDTAISGHLGAPKYLAAIAVGGMMLNVIFFLFGFLRMGTTGLTAEAYGASDRSGLRRIYNMAFQSAFGIGLIVIFLGWPLCELLTAVMDPPEEVEILTRRYFMICILEAPAQLAVMALNGWMVGMQSTVRPMIVAICVNVINIIISVSAVFVLKLSFIGIALGTMLSNWIGMFLALYLARKCYDGEKLHLSIRDTWKTGGLGRFFKVNTDLFVRSGCIMAVSLGMTSIGARIGEDALAVNAVLMQFFMLFSYFMDGFGFAAEALSGRYYGAHDLPEFKKSVKALLLWSATMALIFTLIYGLGNEVMVGLLTSENSVRASATLLYPLMVVLPSVSVAAFIFDGFYIGLIATRKMMWTTMLSVTVFFAIALFYKGSFSAPSNFMLWVAFLSYLFARGLVLALQFPHTVKTKFS
ncbi:MAG: MATE family efflux transporter [Muribaculum sp.]|nr:MATE family efflux transporter [Muribaculum sp.]